VYCAYHGPLALNFFFTLLLAPQTPKRPVLLGSCARSLLTATLIPPPPPPLLLLLACAFYITSLLLATGFCSFNHEVRPKGLGRLCLYIIPARGYCAQIIYVKTYSDGRSLIRSTASDRNTSHVVLGASDHGLFTMDASRMYGNQFQGYIAAENYPDPQYESQACILLQRHSIAVAKQPPLDLIASFDSSPTRQLPEWIPPQAQEQSREHPHLLTTLVGSIQ
jgi:hypothetical protein